MDYSKYSLEELLDAQKHIDAEQYPENFKLLKEALDTKYQESKCNDLDDEFQNTGPAYKSDEIARKINWSPLSSHLSTFASKAIYQVNEERIEFRPSRGLKVTFCILILICISLILSTFILELNLEKGEKVGATIFTIILGVFIFLVSASTWHYHSTPIIFDKRVGASWKSKKPLDDIKNKFLLEYFVKLSDIYAIQILNQLVPDYESDEGDGDNCYEINLVTKYAQRINVLGDGNQLVLLQQAQQLSEFLNLPIWDRSENEFDWNSKFNLGLE